MVFFLYFLRLWSRNLKKHETYDKVAPQRLKMETKMDQEVSKRSPRVAKRSRREPKRANLEATGFKMVWLAAVAEAVKLS